MQERLSTLLAFLDESPEDAFLLFAIAQEYIKLGNDDMARMYFTELREHHPTYTGLYYHLGKLELRQGRQFEAIAIFEQGIAIAKSAGDTHAWSELKAALDDLQDM